jgi:osmotically inducible lipoprotein OsmB
MLLLHKRKTAALALCLMLCACGTTPTDRAISGGAIGAGVGTAAAIIVNGNPLTGLLVGAAAGAVTGGVTQDKDFNLGRPIWETWQH